jgi:hypothetical protein
MIPLPDLEPETVKTFEAAVTELFPDATFRHVEQTIMGPPYLIIWIPDETSVVPITLCIDAGQGLQGVDKNNLRVVDL